MDAGMRDNFGTEVASRYLYVLRDWIAKNTSGVIFLEIRDTRENASHLKEGEDSFGEMLTDPIFVIQHRWQTFQSYNHGFIKDFLPHALNTDIHFIKMQYHPQHEDEGAALNFHLTNKEKEDVFQSIYYTENQVAIDSIVGLLK
jgi:hypothetical protein